MSSARGRAEGRSGHLPPQGRWSRGAFHGSRCSLFPLETSLGLWERKRRIHRTSVGQKVCLALRPRSACSAEAPLPSGGEPHLPAPSLGGCGRRAFPSPPTHRSAWPVFQGFWVTVAGSGLASVVRRGRDPTCPARCAGLLARRPNYPRGGKAWPVPADGDVSLPRGQAPSPPWVAPVT